MLMKSGLVASNVVVRFLLLSIMLFIALHQGWGTCGPRETLIWPTLAFSLPKLSTTSCQNDTQ